MAKVIGPLHSDDARGAYGDVLKFSSWRGRNYVQRFRKPRNPRTAAQTAVRVTTQALSVYWRTLELTVRQAWTAYAGEHPVIDPWTGQASIIPGYGWFCKANAILLNSLNAIRETPPISPIPAPLANPTLTHILGTLLLDFGIDALPAGVAAQALLFESPSAGRTPSDSNFRVAAYSEAAAVDGMPLKPCVEGIYYSAAIRTFLVDEGLTGAFVRTNQFTYVAPP